MPCDYSKYPVDWKQIRARILERAGNCCEWCRIPNYACGWRDADGKFWRTGGNLTHDAAGNGELSYTEARELVDHANDACDGLGLNGERGVVIVLTIAHLDHDTDNNSDGNLAALCNRCHLKHDAQFHATNAAATRLAKKERDQLPLLA